MNGEDGRVIVVSDEELEKCAEKYLEWKDMFKKYLKIASITTFEQFLSGAMSRKYRRP